MPPNRAAATTDGKTPLHQKESHSLTQMYMAHERRAHILRLLAERGSIRSAALALELGVTDETIRTDLVLLEREGQLRRRHGGAEFLPPPTAGAASDETRLDVQLARALLPHIPPQTRLMADATRLTSTLLTLLNSHPLTLLTHSPQLLQDFAAEALPFNILCIGGELDKTCRRIDPAPGAVAQAAPSLAILCPERVELRGHKTAIAYTHRADQHWAQEAITHAHTLLLAFPSSAIAPWSGTALPCTPQFLVTEDNLPAGATPAHAQLLPYLDPASLLPENGFDY